MSIQDQSPLVTLHNAIVAAQASMRHPRMDKGAQTSEALRMILDAATKEAMRELRDLRARAVEMEKALRESHPVLEDLCLSLDDSCTLMQSLIPAMQQTGSTEHIVAGLMAQEGLKKLCRLLGHETSFKLTGTLPPAP